MLQGKKKLCRPWYIRDVEIIRFPKLRYLVPKVTILGSQSYDTWFPKLRYLVPKVTILGSQSYDTVFGRNYCHYWVLN
jgi:hypothetical protein